MKIKLIDVKTYPEQDMVGTCDLCMSVEWIDKPVYVIEVDGCTYDIDGYEWEYGHYTQTMVDNVIDFADYLNTHQFQEPDEMTTSRIEETFLTILNDYSHGWTSDLELLDDVD